MASASLTTAVVWTAATAGGWYHDLSVSGERIVIDPADTDLGKVTWLSSVPDQNNPCRPGGDSRLYAASFDSALSQLYQPGTLGTANPIRVANYDPQAGSVGLRLARIGGTLRAVVTGQFGELKLAQGVIRTLSPRAMNWREVTEPGR
jgi:hypothetical protein